jgi:hypothetical protein
MKKCIYPCLVLALAMLSHPVFSQAKQDTASLGMAGDNLDLYAVLELFLKSKTIEGFEKSLNEQKKGINNLDLDLDKKVDFIKVVTKKDGNAYTFVLQVAVSKTETQDVAVILVNKDKDGKVSVQIVGDEDLYGKDYVIEPKTSASPSVTANPAYQGSDPVTKDVPASTTTVVVQTAPVVQYVYSPAYVPYYPPYYYGYYPPYFAMAATIAVGIYRANNYYYHGGYYGGHYNHNTVVINNRNQINHYNNTRNTSNRVQNNMANGNYGNGNRGGGAGNRPSTGGPSASTRPSNGGAGSNRPSNNGPSASTRPSNGPSASTRETGFSNGNRGSSSMNEGRTRSSGGGGYSGGGGSRGGGGYSGGGGSRGGGGGRRR